MDHMDFSHLMVFCTVVDSGSISRAAKKLFVSQPSISVKIQELEEHYRVKLLDRTNKGVHPTEVGLFVYDEAERILEMLENIQRQIERARDSVERLSVGASGTIGSYALPCTLFIFKERYPDYNIILDIDNSSRIIDKILNRKVEIGLVEGPIQDTLKDSIAKEGFNTKKIDHTELLLITPNAAPYSDMDSMTLKDIQEIPLIVREQGSGIRATMEKVFSENGMSLSKCNVVLELNTINGIVSAISSGRGVSLLPRMALRKELRHRILKSIKVENSSFRHDFNLLYQPGVKKSSYSTFVNLLGSSERGFC